MRIWLIIVGLMWAWRADAKPLDWFVADEVTAASLTDALNTLWEAHEITVLVGEPAGEVDGFRSTSSAVVLWLDGMERLRTEASTIPDQVVLARSFVRDLRFTDPNWTPEIPDRTPDIVPVPVPELEPPKTGLFATGWIAPSLRFSGQLSAQGGFHVGVTPRRFGYGFVGTIDATELVRTSSSQRAAFTRFGGQLTFTWWTSTTNSLGKWGIGLVGAVGGKAVVGVVPDRFTLTVPVELPVVLPFAVRSGGHATVSFGAHTYTPKSPPFPARFMIGGRIDFDTANGFSAINFSENSDDANFSAVAIRIDLGLIAGRPWDRAYKKP